MPKKTIVDLILDSYLIFSDGYGYAAIQFARVLGSLPEVNLVIPESELHVYKELPHQVQSAVTDNIKKLSHFKKVNFRTPPPLVNESWPRESLYWYTCWETTMIPTGWSELLNTYVSKVFVPTTKQVDIFRDGGVKVPIVVIPHGVNQAHYHLLNRTERADDYTFGFYATVMDHRKGVDVLIKAFTLEFPASQYPNVYLRLKGREQFNWPDSNRLIPDDHRISIDQRITSVEGNLRFLEQIDCFVFPTRGEGFGLPPLEAMATGLPVIVTNWSGPEDYMIPEFTFPLQYELSNVSIPTRNPLYTYSGYWAEPDLEHLQYLMKYCYQNKQEARLKGEKAAQYVANDWTWELAAKKLLESL